MPCFLCISSSCCVCVCVLGGGGLGMKPTIIVIKKFTELLSLYHFGFPNRWIHLQRHVMPLEALILPPLNQTLSWTVSITTVQGHLC